MRHEIYLLSMLSWRSSAIDQIHKVDVDRAASQGHICVSSAQSLMPTPLRRVAYSDSCGRYCQAVRLLSTDSLAQWWLRGWTNIMTAGMLFRHPVTASQLLSLHQSTTHIDAVSNRSRGLGSFALVVHKSSRLGWVDSCSCRSFQGLPTTWDLALEAAIPSIRPPRRESVCV